MSTLYGGYDGSPIDSVVEGATKDKCAFLVTGEGSPRGEPYDRTVDTVVPQVQNIGQSVRAAITFKWYEEAAV